MSFLKTGTLAAALAGAAALGAALAPIGQAQSRRAAVAPQANQVFSIGGGRIGVTVSDLEPAEGQGPSAGVRIDSVEEGSPAQKAGFKQGDVVVEFDGERVRGVRQFTRLVSETPSGRTVTAAVQRDGQRITLNVTPRESSTFRFFNRDEWRLLDDMPALAIPPAPPAPRAAPAPHAVPAPPAMPLPPSIQSFFWGGSQLGVSVQELPEQLGDYFGAKNGVLVTTVEADSAAAKAGVKAGDVITTINGEAVEDPGDLRRRVQRLEDGEEFTLEILRDKKGMTLKGKFEPMSARRRATTRSIV